MSLEFKKKTFFIFFNIARIWLNLPVDHLPFLLYQKIDQKNKSAVI
jgi:hypothetical protein